jgi:hypothetical protein
VAEKRVAICHNLLVTALSRKGQSSARTPLERLDRGCRAGAC